MQSRQWQSHDYDRCLPEIQRDFFTDALICAAFTCDICHVHQNDPRFTTADLWNVIDSRTHMHYAALVILTVFMIK